MKKAILAVSFGTSYAEVEQSCIRPVEDALRAASPEYDVYRAFTSRIIMRKLCGQGVVIESEEEALARLNAEGYDEIIVVPTHIIPGHEYEKVCAAATGYRISKPLLSEEANLDWMAGVLSEIASEENRPLLLMGHGTDHAHNDLAGDEDDSWKSILTARGFDVHVRMQGLGALKDVQQRFVDKASDIVF